ncbi:MAG: amidohydrolase [Alphaproteobacteria bacterium]|nr:amidohydrolase [Alphaproteobacteria bacterium]
MEALLEHEVNEPNLWRLETPGAKGWPRTARASDPNKMFILSADGHVQEPGNMFAERVPEKFQKRLPRVEVDDKGGRWSVQEGFRKAKLRESTFEGEEKLRNLSGKTPEERLADLKMDGVDGEVLFPNKGLMMWATRDADFCREMCFAWNEWAWEMFGPYNDRLKPLAGICTATLEHAMAEITRVAKLGFSGLCLPCKPVFGPHDHNDPNYNLPMFDPMWALIEEVNLPITFHVSTGRDPRASKGNGGAVINYVSHSLAPTIEPMANLCSSGVLERFPRIKFATIEAGIGWVAWALEAMDEAYKKHHMWARPKLQGLPSDYYRANGYSSFQEDAPGLALAEQFNLVDNFMWANDYPHHEGTWPHSAEAIERQFGHLKHESRMKILGLNAARLFKFEVPDSKKI